MIKRFRDFFIEELPIRIGTYVLVDPGRQGIDVSNEDIVNFIRNNVGKVIKILSKKHYNIVVMYENVPKNLIGGYLFDSKFNLKMGTAASLFNIEQIIYQSDNKEDCETFLDSKKYNL